MNLPALRTASLLVVLAICLVPATVAAQNMCVECNGLRAQLRIVEQKTETFEQGLDLLRETKRDLERDAAAADSIGAAYLILQSLNISLGLATLPCSLSIQWLKGLVGGASGLGAYIENGEAGKASLAAIVGYVGFGVANDVVSTRDFLKQYSEGREGVRQLHSNVDDTIQQFATTLKRLEDEEFSLKTHLADGGCGVTWRDAH